MKVQDLEDTVATLKRLLRERDNEVNELRSSQRKATTELHSLKSQADAAATFSSPAEVRCFTDNNHIHKLSASSAFWLVNYFFLF